MQVQLIRPQATIPARQTSGAAGYELHTVETATLEPCQWRGFRTGLRIHIPNGTTGQIWPRSGLALQQCLGIPGGIIENDYRGELMVILENRGKIDLLAN